MMHMILFNSLEYPSESVLLNNEINNGNRNTCSINLTVIKNPYNNA